MKFFGKQNEHDENEEMNNKSINSPQTNDESGEDSQSAQPKKTGGIPNIAPAGFGAKAKNEPTDDFTDFAKDDSITNDNSIKDSSGSLSSTTSLGNTSIKNNSMDDSDSLDQLEKASEDSLEDSLVDEDELLSHTETSALKKEKEPVLEIITPTLSGSDSELKSLEREGALTESEVDESVSNSKNTSRRSLFAKKEKVEKEKKPKSRKSRRKDRKTEDSLKAPRLDDNDEEFDDEEQTEKKKKSLSEMTFKDLLPSKKEKTELKIPIGGNIVIDLMPQSHKDIVATRDAKRRWTSIFAIVVAACLVFSGLSFAYNMQTQAQVSAEQSRQEAIDLQIARHAEVNQALQSEKTARGLLETSAGNEIDWNELISTIQTNLPQGTRITSLNVITGGTPEDEVSSAITMNLTSDSTLGYSDSLRAVENINGVQQVEIGGLSVSGDNAYTYTMSFTFDNSILTERFATVAEPEEAAGEAPVAPEDNPILTEDGEIDPDLLDTVDEAAQSEGDE